MSNREEMPVKQTAGVADIVHSLNVYVGTYPNQTGYEDFSTMVVLQDLLYGIGRAMAPEDYQGASGFVAFKRDLKRFLENDPGLKEDEPKKDINEALHSEGLAFLDGVEGGE